MKWDTCPSFLDEMRLDKMGLDEMCWQPDDGQLLHEVSRLFYEVGQLLYEVHLLTAIRRCGRRAQVQLESFDLPSLQPALIL